MAALICYRVVVPRSFFLSFSLVFLCLMLVSPVSVSGHPCSFAVCSSIALGSSYFYVAF